MSETARARSRGPPSSGRILPEEVLVFEILVRLPGKELPRCRAVCRYWRRLTSTNGRVVLHASCDGLILLLSPASFHICNPATRQWASLPALAGGHVAGLYPHGSSGEYRILFWKRRFKGDNSVYYVLMVGSLEEPRCIGVPIASARMNRSSSYPPVLLHNCLHSVQGWNRLVVFDTVGESFRSIHSPVGDDDRNPYLHEMEGMLRMSCTDSEMLKVWVLVDYDKEVWSLKYHIELPKVASLNSHFITSYTALSEKGDMLFFSFKPAGMFRCDNKGKLLEEFRWESCDPCDTKHRFKESLISHAFFPIRGCREEPYFLRGLGGKRNRLLNRLKQFVPVFAEYHLMTLFQLYNLR